MRRILALAALALVAAAPLGALAQTDSAPPVYYSLVDEGFSANSAWSRAGTNGNWFAITDSGRAVAYTAKLANGTPAGYENDAVTTLTSPAVSTAGHAVRSLEFTVRGSSRAGDALAFQVKAGTGDWTTLATYEGTADEAAYRTTVLDDAGITGLADKTLQFRWRFTSDATGNSTGGPSPDNPPICGETPAPPAPAPDPAGAVCETEPDLLGWFVDSVRLNVRRLFQPPAGATVTTIPLSATASGTVTVDLAADAGKFIELRFDETQVNGAQGNVASVSATFVRSGAAGGTLALAKSGTLWTTLLAVDEPDLVAGTYLVRFDLLGHAGDTGQLGRTLVVTSADATPPVITVAQSGLPIRVGPGQAVEATVADATLRRVTYQFDGLPNEVDLPYPYSLPDTSLPEGPTTLVLRAYDRAGHTSTLSAPVDRDTTTPFLQVGLPAQFYDRVPATVELLVGERTPHTIRLDANGTGQSASSNGGNTTHAFTVVPNGTAPLVLRISVQDAVGNRMESEHVLPVAKPVTDSRVRSIKVDGDGPLFAQRPVRLTATLDQLGGVTDLPVTVAFTAGGRSTADVVTLPRVGPLEVPWNATLPAGRHTVLAQVTAPAFANETDPANQNATLPIEVFLGSVYDGDRLLLIRADERGLPASALLHGSSRTFATQLVNLEGQGVVYRIQLEAGRTLDWDPLSPIAEPPAPPTTSDDKDDKDAPFPGLLVSLAVLALALLRRRR